MPSNETPSKNPTDGTPPLVRIERIDGVLFAIFTDPARPGFEYDPSIRSVQQALEIARHVAEKRWVTALHLQQYKALMLAEFGEGACNG
ncbi:hypothetical protein [Xanthomonas arboricola]|uniref:hypothetical protein n=1 Tax=Xanthomonas arboricola TaxID=56448 RepID=UPI003EBED0BD